MGHHACRYESHRKLEWEPTKTTCAVQGFGNVGSWASKYLQEEGLKIVAISDHTGGYFNADGIDVNTAIEYVKAKGMLEGFSGGTHISNAELVELDVDLLVPAAVENVITGKNAEKIKAKLIVEGANGPVSSEADAILDENGIVIVPDILANAGGVTVSYFEWVQNRRGHYYTEEEIANKTRPILSEAFEKVWETHKEYGCSMRIAAYIVAIQRLATGIDLEGIF